MGCWKTSSNFEGVFFLQLINTKHLFLFASSSELAGCQGANECAVWIVIPMPLVMMIRNTPEYRWCCLDPCLCPQFEWVLLYSKRCFISFNKKSLEHFVLLFNKVCCHFWKHPYVREKWVKICFHILKLLKTRSNQALKQMKVAAVRHNLEPFHSSRIVIMIVGFPSLSHPTNFLSSTSVLLNNLWKSVKCGCTGQNNFERQGTESS